ncbi:evasin-1-like [Amblyomma americanum]
MLFLFNCCYGVYVYLRDPPSDEHSAPVRVLGSMDAGAVGYILALFVLCEYHVLATNDVYDEKEPCLIPGLNTTKGPLNSGCKIECIDGSTKSLKNGRKCLDIPLDVIKRMPNYVEFYCPLGRCKNGVCKRNNRIVVCQKFPVYWITPPGR